MPIGQVSGVRSSARPDAISSSSASGSRALAVDLVDEGDDRDVAQPADLEQLARLALDALGRVDHHHRRVDRAQRAIGVLAEVGVTGRVEQVERRCRSRSKVITELVTEMPRACSIAIQSERVRRALARAP